MAFVRATASNGIVMTRQRSRELEQRERLCRALLGNSIDPIALLDGDGTIRLVTDPIERLTGFTPAELVGRSAFEHVHPDDEPLVRKALQDAIANPGVPVPLEYRASHKDGSWRVREVIGVNRLDDPDIRAIVVNYRDTTARRRAEAALEESERLHQSTFDEAPIGVAHTSLAGRFLHVNRWLCRVLGYSPEELTTLDFMKLTHPDEVEQDVEARLRLISGQLDRYTREKRYRRKDGSFVPVNLAVSVHRNRQGDAVYFIAVIEDLTERNCLEQQLRQAQKMEAIGRLAGGIAHDFNNLLVVIGGYADLIVHSLGPDHPSRKDSEEIQAAARSATALTRQLLAFSRRQILQPQILDLNEVLRRVESLLRRLIGEDVTLVMSLATPLLRVHADPGQVEQIIMNLAVNARDAMPIGGRLTIETANVDLDVAFVNRHRGSATGSHVMIAVSDTGSGMNAETLQHLFEPFFTTKPPGRGTGLGLSTVYGIVKQSRGSIWVYSEVGQGSTFKIYLPAISTGFEQGIDVPQICGRHKGAGDGEGGCGRCDRSDWLRR
jgi:two-component system, cell cycle sensor histidine kinase and response regulator CckA